MNAAVRIEASPAVTLAETERALEAKENGRAAQRRAVASAAAVTTEARNRSAESPGDRRLAEAVVDARRAESIESESLTAWDRSVEEAERQVAVARRAADQVELADAERRGLACLAELPPLRAELAGKVRGVGSAADQIEDIITGKYAEAYECARQIATRLGVSCPLRPLALDVERVASGLFLADQIGVPDVEAEDLRSHAGVVRAFALLREAQLDTETLIPALDRFLIELDCAIGASTARWAEALRDPPWGAVGEERERFEAAEALLEGANDRRDEA